ncbi:ABC transporter substrate-binding protein [uncultured Friedmanniella sp.]|uniref:ABC transporter substrate-binding protein n=1 Tax=uncultured Friedmanniella sp. TaxID=335381 RepID=UPI0035CB40FD
MTGSTPNPMSRRGFLGLAATAAAVPTLAACNVSGSSNSGGTGGSADPIKFWDQPWGTTAYNDLGKKITDAYAPAAGMGKANYQVIPWNNFYQTYASAIASGTGPAVSSGGGFQPFQFAEQGAIAYADNLVEAWKKDGTYDDFLPGLAEANKTDNGIAAMPWQLDSRIMWANTKLLEQAGAEVPTDFDSLLKAGLALKKIGVFGFGTGTGAGNNFGSHTMVALMIMNGGGLFTPDGKPDCLIDRNVEAMEFVKTLANEGIIDPASISYTSDNLYASWSKKKIGLGIANAGLQASAAAVADDLEVISPLAGPHGDKAALHFVNSIMMYQKTPSQAASEAFMSYYFKNIHQYWDANQVGGVPVLKSIAASDAIKKNKAQTKIISEYVPISTTYAAKGTKMFAGLASVDGGQALTQFAQTMLQGKTDAKTALTKLQAGIEEAVK